MKPVALERPYYFLVFRDDGVYRHPLTADPDRLPTGTWALSDSNNETQWPCTAFLSAANEQIAWIVQTTSPLKKSWKDWSKYYNADMFVMNHISIEEITALGLVRLGFYKCFLLADPFPTAKYSVSTSAISDAFTNSGVLLRALAHGYHWKAAKNRMNIG